MDATNILAGVIGGVGGFIIGCILAFFAGVTYP